MIYPLLGATAGLALFFYQQPQPTNNQLEVTTIQTAAPNHTFNDTTILPYTQLRTQKNKFVIYSRLHQQPLATHTLITKQMLNREELDKKQRERQLENNKIYTTSQESAVKQNQSANPQSETAQNSTNKTEQTVINKNQILYSTFFNKYAAELITSNKCNSVELIEGPIFSKDTPYKDKTKNDQKIDQVFTSFVKINPKGQHLTDKFYTIVICNQQNNHHINGFTMRRSPHPTFKLTNYLTSLLKIQEQTGLTFNIRGQPLTLIDFENINRERNYSDYQSVQNQ